MGRVFYASGFLYHPATDKVLLKQLTRDDETKLTFFRGKSTNGYDPQMVFRLCVEDELGINIGTEIIYPVYDYIHEQLGEHFVFFAQMKGEPAEFGSKLVSGWISFSKLAKYRMSDQTRHDLTIGSRVIRHLTETDKLHKTSDN